MISSKSEEQLLLRWLFGEIIYQQHKGVPTNKPEKWSWATITRFQKILFSTLEQHDLPATRSWYMWGGYIHSDIFEREKFNYFRKRYSTNPDKVLRLREGVKKFGISIDDIIESVNKISDKVLSMRSKDYIPLYYKHESPLEYRDLYVSKQNITDYYDLFSSYTPYRNYEHFSIIEDDFQQNLYLFNLFGSNLLDNVDLNQTSYKFNNIVGITLDKSKVVLLLEESMPNIIFSFFKRIDTFFKEYIWKPYACEVSQNTVKGLRADEERRLMVEKEVNSIHFGKEKIDELYALLKRNKLEPSYDDYKILEDRSDVDPKIRNLVDNMLKIYTKKDDEID